MDAEQWNAQKARLLEIIAPHSNWMLGWPSLSISIQAALDRIAELEAANSTLRASCAAAMILLDEGMAAEYGNSPAAARGILKKALQ